MVTMRLSWGLFKRKDFCGANFRFGGRPLSCLQFFWAADADIDAVEAWDISTGSSSIKVAVIDTGVDYTHPDLVDNMWTNPGEIAGNGIDDDENGFIDDVHGWDFANDDSDPMDDHSHGTHCAGTIGGVGNNGIGVAGVCWDVEIVALKWITAGGSGVGSDAPGVIGSIGSQTQMGSRVGQTSPKALRPFPASPHEHLLKSVPMSAQSSSTPLRSQRTSVGIGRADGGPSFPYAYFTP